jgi:hypothetical protein
MRRFLLPLLLLGAALNASAGTGKVVIVNIDLPNVGFNDATPAQPIGGNPGLTIGEQRMNVFQAAAARWTTMLDTNVDIIVQASFSPLQCDDTGAVLASAGPRTFLKDFTNAPQANVWYPIALANKFSGVDLGPTIPDVITQFNGDVDNAECLGDQDWYYGLDGNHGTDSDLFVVVLHELAHGFGISGAVGSPGFRDNIPSVFDIHTLDRTAGLRWDQMTEQQRDISMTNTRNLVWDGAYVSANLGRFLQPVTTLTISEPSAVARNFDIGTASFGPVASRTALSGSIVRAVDAANSEGPTTFDGCSAFSNAAAVRGNVALIDRGSPPAPADPCTFVKKARHAQEAGAIGVIIVDNARTTCQPPSMGGDAADITIPIVSISAIDGDALKTQLTAGATVRGALRTDSSQLAGASQEGKMRLYAPCTEEPGSSVHHWDVTAMPNLLMEPAVNGDLLHGVDLTLYQLLDMGWSLPEKTGRRALKR